MAEEGSSRVLPLALTMGDPAGIGPEITLKAWAARRDDRFAPFCFYGSAATLRDRAQQLRLDVPVAVISDPAQAQSTFATALPVIDIPLGTAAVAGQPDSANGPAIVEAIWRAVVDVRNGLVGAVVTNPIAKSVLYKAGFTYPGHTEYLAALAGDHWQGGPYQPVMMLACADLKVVPLTIHIPLAAVQQRITRDLIASTVRITADALRHDFGIAAPRIAVAGLNPHAGEDGSIGTEERDVIAPVLAELAQEGIALSGPLPADTMFHAAARATYDAAICMYHDQALIPIKTLAFDEGVNVTLGLPFVRTSPDHGTAFGIADQGTASPRSLIEALKLASAMAARRHQASA